MNERQFWEHPLGSWLNDVALGSEPVIEERSWRAPSRLDLPLQYGELCDGVLLSFLFHQIDPSSVDVVSPREVRVDQGDSRAKQRLFVALIDAIRKLYRWHWHRQWEWNRVSPIVTKHRPINGPPHWPLSVQRPAQKRPQNDSGDDDSKAVGKYGDVARRTEVVPSPTAARRTRFPNRPLPRLSLVGRFQLDGAQPLYPSGHRPTLSAL
ncbi:hypothetical protein Q1695_004192 [Nippostrongylus brasiliensis]|nr:hypothetical protein Q1695_004192 [Nippostrongylus brasiliensis]